MCPDCISIHVLDGIIVVTSPQELVGMIVAKAVNGRNDEHTYFSIVENMSYLNVLNVKEYVV